MSLEEFPLRLPRNAFSPRETARAGEWWRLLQDAAVIGSSRRGWPPERYREEQCAFVVRTMTVLHHGPTAFGDPLVARTWVSAFLRDMFSSRQIRVSCQGRAVTSASQRWVHVVLPDLKPARANASLLESFGIVDLEPDVALPEHRAASGPPHVFRFRAWHTWMDPLAHANHPAYIDWSDEAISRVMAGAGVDPQLLRPVAEQVTFRSGVRAPEEVVVRSQLEGVADSGAVATSHRVEGGDGRVCADVLTVRTLADGDPDALRAAMA